MHTIAPEHLHCVSAEIAKQTIDESNITYAFGLTDRTTILHGTRDGLPIVIVKIENQQPDELCAVWFDETAQKAKP